MRHIYKIFPSQIYSSIHQSVENTKARFNELRTNGITKDGIDYSIGIDDISILYRQMSSNITSLTEEQCICFAIAFGNVGLISLDDYSNKTRIINLSQTDIDALNGNVSLDDSIRYVVVNPTRALTFNVSNVSSEFVRNYEVDITIGDDPFPITFENIRWLGVEPSFKPNKRYLIYIDDNIGVSTEL